MSFVVLSCVFGFTFTFGHLSVRVVAGLLRLQRIPNDLAHPCPQALPWEFPAMVVVAVQGAPFPTNLPVRPPLKYC